MKDNKLTQLIGLLSPEEQENFLHYLHTPLFNQKALLPKLFRLLSQSKIKWEKKYLHRALFGESTPFSEQSMYDVFSQLSRHLEQYISLLKWKEKRQTQVDLSLESYLERGADKQFDRLWQKADKQSKNVIIQDAQHYFTRYQLSEKANQSFGQQQKRVFDENLDQLMLNLDTFYLAEKLKYSCDMLNRNNIINTQYESPFIDSLIQTIEAEGERYLGIPLISIYYRIYHGLKAERVGEHFEILKALLYEHAGKFSKSEAYAMYSYAQNYCIKQINQGQPDFQQPYFDLGLDMLDKGLLMDEGYLVHWHYKNLITIGTRLGRDEWVEDFLENYKAQLKPELQEGAYYYNKGAFLYAKGQFKAAMQCLQKAHFPDLYYNLSARTLLLKIYFEREDLDAFLYHVKAFRHYLKRNQEISAYQRKIHRNLLRFSSKLIRLQQHPKRDQSDEKWQKLREEIQTEPAIADKGWLLKQM